MELMEAMKGRRSVRKFQDRLVPKETIQSILDVMEYSPNAGNRNSIRTVVLTDREEIDYIGKAHTTVIESFNKGVVSLPSEEEIEAAPSAFHNAPTVLALFGPKNFYFSPADAYILAQNIALAAYEKGVSTCIVGEVLNSMGTEKGQALQKAFGIPENFAPQVYITMGYCEGAYPKRLPRHYAEVVYR
ncbi:MAG: nitroreductase family protein [Eubacterium sp.]|jgi:nitroreductase|uniref:nitroreductase family protein n=1 Tax=Eubacterium sp. F2 TaxID=3381348 RepID=UPI00360B0309|nr:nitroreductase family protein [Eubacterium sp.]MCI2197690.1 nitroreductase family protein [Eubacterium sp.]